MFDETRECEIAKKWKSFKSSAQEPLTDAELVFFLKALEFESAFLFSLGGYDLAVRALTLDIEEIRSVCNARSLGTTTAGRLP